MNFFPAKDFLGNKISEDAGHVYNHNENQEPFIKKNRSRPKHTNKILTNSEKDDILHSALDCSLLQPDREDISEFTNNDRNVSSGEKDNNTIDDILPEEIPEEESDTFKFNEHIRLLKKY